MTRKITYRVTDVAASESEPVGRLRARDSEEHEVTFELPTAWLRGLRRGETITVEIVL